MTKTELTNKLRQMMSDMLANLAKCDELPEEAKTHIANTCMDFNEDFIALLPDQTFTKEDLSIIASSYDASVEQITDKLFAVS